MIDKPTKAINWNRIGWLLGALFFVIILTFAAKQSGLIKCAKVEVSILSDQTTDEGFLNHADILKTATPIGILNNLVGLMAKDLRTDQIEKAIEDNPYVKNAEVYLSLNGTLSVEVIERKPILRVFKNGSGGFYIDQDGEKMPLSRHYAARVPVATGYIKETLDKPDSLETNTAKNLFILIQKLHEDNFWSTFVEQIEVKENGDFVLIPKIGKQQLLIGDVSSLDSKLLRLKVFYNHAMSRVGWQTYSILNVKFNNQIVCVR